MVDADQIDPALAARLLGALPLRFLPLLTFHPPPVSLRAYQRVFCCVAAGLVLWVLVIFRGNFRIVSFADVYDLRSGADDIMEGSSVQYAGMLLSAVIGPFLMAWGIVRKRI